MTVLYFNAKSVLEKVTLDLINFKGFFLLKY